MATGLKRKEFYAFQVMRTNPGAGADGILVKSGYLSDDGLAIAPGQYPDKEDRITSENTAISRALAYVRRYQADGKDCYARVYVKVFGEDVPGCVRPLGDNEDFSEAEGGKGREVARLDVLEKSAKDRIRYANTSATGGVDLDELDSQDLDNAVGG